MVIEFTYRQCTISAAAIHGIRRAAGAPHFFSGDANTFPAGGRRNSAADRSKRNHEIGMSAQNSLTVDTTRRTWANNRLLNVTKSNAPAEGVSMLSTCSFAKQHIYLLIWVIC